MLLPKYSIRTLLLIMVGVALFALLVTFAMRGSIWTLAVAIGIGSLFFVALVHAGMFLVTVMLAQFVPRRRPPKPNEQVDVPRAPMPEAPH